MSLIDRNTTDDEVRDLWADNVGWSNPFDRTKAANFVEICRHLLFRAPMAIELDGINVQSKPDLIEKLMRQAERALGSTDESGSSARFCDFTDFRS